MLTQDQEPGSEHRSSDSWGMALSWTAGHTDAKTMSSFLVSFLMLEDKTAVFKVLLTVP